MATNKRTCKSKTVKYRRSKPAKVYKNENGKVVYKQSTDKVGDVLINQAGVKYTITGEKFHTPSGYDDGKLKVRILQVKTSEGQSFEIGDNNMQYFREKKVLTRTNKQKKTCKPKTAKPAPVAPAKNKPTSPKTAKPTSPKTTAKPSEGKSYTVRQGRTCKTFATKTEAQACASQSKKATITTTTKPPTHRIVKFAVKK